MSVALGLTLGIGLLLIWWSFWPRPRRRAESRRPSRLRRLLAEAGHRRVGVSGVLTAMVGCGLVSFLTVLVLTTALPLALCFGAFGAVVPIALLRWQADKRQAVLREIWPDAVDHLRSAVRAGMSLPEALIRWGPPAPSLFVSRSSSSPRTTAQDRTWRRRWTG